MRGEATDFSPRLFGVSDFSRNGKALSMNSAEHDAFAAGCYPNIALAGHYHEYFYEYKMRVTRDIPNRSRDPADDNLPLGCWIGRLILKRTLAISESRFPGPGKDLAISSRRIRTADQLIDVAVSGCGFHPIPREEHVR